MLVVIVRKFACVIFGLQSSVYFHCHLFGMLLCAYQMLFEHADERLKKLADDLQIRQSDYTQSQQTFGVFDASDYFLKNLKS